MDGIRPYPWHALERVGPSACAAIALARESFAGHWHRRAIERELSGVTGQSVRIPAVAVRAATSPPLPGAARLSLQTPDRSVLILLELEAALAAHLVAALLRRPPPLPDPLAPVPESVQGAAAALALLVSRRLGSPLALHSVGGAVSQPPGSTALGLDATMLLGDESFACRATLWLKAQPTRGVPCFDSACLQRLGELPLALALVIGVAQVPRPLVLSLRPGDVLVPGGPWLIMRSEAGLRGHPALCASAADRGLRVDMLGPGKIVLGEGTMSLDSDEQGAAASTTADALADAPVVIRIELGQVSMSARAWAALRPGDVIATGTRIAERAVLRIGGREVARGELVDIEGELGVRIHELLGQDNGGSA